MAGINPLPRPLDGPAVKKDFFAASLNKASFPV